MSELLYSLSNIPEVVKTQLTLAKFKVDEGNKGAYDTIQDLIRDKVAYPLVLLVGQPGLGKTHLAVALGIYRLEHGKSVYYFHVSEFLDSLRAGYRIEQNLQANEFNTKSYSAIMNYAKQCHTFILDDFGVQKDTDWATEHLDVIVDYRYFNRKELIITNNTTTLTPRIEDRCKDGRIVLLKGQSHRGTK